MLQAIVSGQTTCVVHRYNAAHFAVFVKLEICNVNVRGAFERFDERDPSTVR